MSDTSQSKLTVPSQAPYTFGLGSQGELIIGWSAGSLPDGTELRMHLVIPAEELEPLRRGLKESQTIGEMLSLKPPPQGAH
jgi:hypothetical protein